MSVDKGNSNNSNSSYSKFWALQSAGQGVPRGRVAEQQLRDMRHQTLSLTGSPGRSKEQWQSVTSHCRGQGHPSAHLTSDLKSLLPARSLYQRCHRKTAKASQHAWLLSPVSLSCRHWWKQGQVWNLHPCFQSSGDTGQWSVSWGNFLHDTFSYGKCWRKNWFTK